MEAKTKYFQNCLGVFQGGGVKGAAYVGAYQEASRWGVSFSELVGTSAGSIVTVLIAAGASPSQLEQIMRELDFKSLLQPSIKLEAYKAPKYASYLKFIPADFVRKYQKVFTHLGLFNSNKLKDWIDQKLHELLPNYNRPIKFKDLLIPTSVIATDLVAKRIEIFSQEKSPNKDVAEAVQSSCNIPLFFQPIQMRYVDGGLLSNLPSFVFEDHSEKLYNRVLAFSLESEPNASTTISSLPNFLKALLDTTLEGNLELQLALQEDLHIISIKTGDISATDFEKIDKKSIEFLIAQGTAATRDFFTNETAKVHTRLKRSDVSKSIFNTNNFITQTVDYRYNEIIISNTNTDWVYELFPTIIRWKELGSNISLLLKESTDRMSHTKFRQRFLKALGINVVLTDDLPFKGFIFDGSVRDRCLAVILEDNDGARKGFHSKQYFGEEDFHAIRNLRESIHKHFSRITPSLDQIAIEKADFVEAVKHLKTLKQYNHSDIQMSVRDFHASDLIFITKYVRGFKYRQIHHLFNLYQRFGLKYFECAKLKLANGQYTLITPPIVEKIGSKFYLVEGNTRFTYAQRNGIGALRCILIENVSDPLPSKGEFTSKELLLIDKDLIGDKRYKEFDYNKFRDIEKAMRDPNTCLI